MKITGTEGHEANPRVALLIDSRSNQDSDICRAIVAAAVGVAAEVRKKNGTRSSAYHPRWFMHYAHKSIPEALDAFQDLGAEVFIPTHWGTFQLGDEPPGYPALDLMRTIEERKLAPSRFLLLDIGELRLLRPVQKGTIGESGKSNGS
jgi:hypothetical protein